MDERLPLRPGMRVGILGLGAAGRAAARFLLREGAEIRVCDQAPRSQFAPDFFDFLDKYGIAAFFGGDDAVFLDGLDLLVPAPGVPLDSPLVADAARRGVTIAGELALAAGRFPAPVVAVTGANGKTTVTGLIGHILKTAGKRPFVGGNIGTPLLDYFENPADYDCIVLEVSSFQLDIAGAFRPDIGLLLNITPDHLDRHGSLENYAAAKRKLFANQQAGDAAILGADDALAAETALNEGVRRLDFGMGPDCACRVGEDAVSLRGETGETTFALTGTRLLSLVNRLNAAAAIPAAKALGCEDAAIRQALADFQPAPHRMAEVAVIDGVTYIDDSKATNIGAAAAALAGCKGPALLIAGGRDKGGDYHLIDGVIKEKVRLLLLIGEAAPLMERAWSALVPCERVADMAAAVRRAHAVAEPGDTVLLAPGCSSFDMFKSYGERGEVFAQVVRNLQEAVKP